MKIDKQSESTLLIAMTEAIQAAEVNSWPWIDIPKDWEDSVKSNLDEEFQKRMYKNLDEGGLSSLIKDFILRKIFEKKIELPKNEGVKGPVKKSLVSYQEFSDPLSVAKELVKFLKSLPINYVICAPAFIIENNFFPSDFSVKLSDQLSIVSRSKIPTEFKIECEESAFDSYVRRGSPLEGDYFRLEKDSAYFIYITSGMVSDRYRPSCFNNFYDDLRAFYGTCIAHDMASYVPFFRMGKALPVFGNSVKDGVFELEIVEFFEDDIQDLSCTYIKESHGKKLQNEQDVMEFFQPVIKVFSSKEFQRLRTSAIWLSRSFHSERGMDRILDATIAIEVLLGDREASDRVGLSKLMANRCAYALGSSADDRRKIHDFFIDFYRLRSDIVHSGRLIISEVEKKMVQKGVNLASRVFRHEAAMN